MKKQFTLFILTLLPMAAMADAVEINGIYYNLIPKAKIAEVTSNPNKYSGNIKIPETVTYNNVECNVTTIGNEAFSSCYNLTSITIPNSVTSIGYSAFQDCGGLTSISIPNSVTSIGYSAFYSCSRLTSVTIGNSVTSIDGSTFMFCSALTSVTIGNSVTSIGNSAFYCCELLTSITIPNSVTSIGESAFRGCSCLSTVSIPNSMTSIGYCAFEGCSGLTSVHITDIAAWCNISFEAYSNPLKYAHHLYINGSEITNLVIPNSVTSIGNKAFSGCSGLTSVTIPNSVTGIGGGAFSDCSGLTSVTIPNNVTSISNNAFSGCSSLSSITIPNSVTSIGWAAFANCPEINDVTCLAESVPDTEKNAFENSLIDYATLHVPTASIEVYSVAVPWNGFKYIVGTDNIEVQKCAIPTISVNGGELTFTCETEGVEYHANYSYNNGIGNGSGNKLILAGTTTAHVSVYASKKGYLDSDPATVDVELNVGKKGDVNQDGVVSTSDVVNLVNIIKKKKKND